MTFIESETAAAITPPPKAKRPARSLRRKLETGRFVVCVEVDPPRGPAIRRVIEAARRMVELGADCVNVGDSPMAEVRMSAVMTAAMLKDRAGVEPIVHISTRDRNLMALQADLMAAHAWGLRNILCIKGDQHALGSYNGAKAVWDINALDLMRILKGFNEGHDAIKKPISPATRFHVGAALNPSASDFAAELKLAKNKIRAGADFFLSQAVFEAAPVERMLEALGPDHLPVVIGIWPVHSARQAAFLNERITQVPSWVCDAIDKAGNGAEQCGLELAQRLLEDLRPLVQGVYFVPSFGRFDGIGDLVAAARQLADRGASHARA